MTILTQTGMPIWHASPRFQRPEPQIFARNHYFPDRLLAGMTELRLDLKSPAFSAVGVLHETLPLDCSFNTMDLIASTVQRFDAEGQASTE